MHHRQQGGNQPGVSSRGYPAGGTKQGVPSRGHQARGTQPGAPSQELLIQMNTYQFSYQFP